MKRLIIADTGPLIIFAKSNRLSILSQMASQILVTNTVMHECVDDSSKPGADLIQKAFENHTLCIINDVEVNEALKKTILDAGEKSAIALAMSLNSKSLTLLIDEDLGRKVANQHKLRVIGSAGILVAAKQKGLITNVEEILKDWQGLGYFLSESLINAVLINAGERKIPRP